MASLIWFILSPWSIPSNLIHRITKCYPKEKTIAGAAIDVFVEEPLPPGSPLLELDNVVLFPHLGWPTDSGFEGFAENAVANILNYTEGKLTRATNPEALEKRKRKSTS